MPAARSEPRTILKSRSAASIVGALFYNRGGPTIVQLSQATGLSISTIRRWMTRLLKAGVASKNDDPFVLEIPGLRRLVRTIGRAPRASRRGR